MHHQYTTPTVYSANASHPIEFLGFQFGGFLCCMIFEIHIVAFLVVAIYIAYDNQLVHTGIFFDADTFWKPTTKFHDDHHKYFHVNLGLQFILWDWLFDTLRKKKDRVYTEETFIGEQDIKNIKNQ